MTDENPTQNNQNVNLISENEKENPVKSNSSFNLVKKGIALKKKILKPKNQILIFQ